MATWLHGHMLAFFPASCTLYPAPSSKRINKSTNKQYFSVTAHLRLGFGVCGVLVFQCFSVKMLNGYMATWLHGYMVTFSRNPVPGTFI